MAILCVDDNAINIKVLQQIMQRLGYSDVDVCFDGEEAVSMCRKRPYDLVLMDLQMPKLDGTSAMKIVREEQTAPHGPAIVALTASAMSGDKEEALHNGFQDYISKPIILTSFIQCLERVYSARKGSAPVNVA
ncbi:CheY-like receiver domain-containing protein [Athelia psychrophila]|uniref:CheY-like receiver domain-containing protein n=1 Tax=Athelia psychrophila TaxID=1759441 RepID=A0A166LGX6_9AGAM|nr:CheY-like receiver domain-containing protein [Fibularhizoctonia sp. CBS 109695]